MALRRSFSSDFYLDICKNYMYTPRTPLSFDGTGKSLIFASNKQVFKLRYLPKLYFANIGLGAIIHSNSMLNFGPIISLVLGSTWGLGVLHAMTGCKVVKSVRLHDCGTKVDVAYRFLRFMDKTLTFDVVQLREQLKPQLMLMWSLNPLPKNLLSALELEEDLLFPCYFPLDQWNFLLFPKPTEHHKEALINVFNGVSVETTRTLGLAGMFKDRFREIKAGSKRS
jgi:hypothetical protein